MYLGWKLAPFPIGFDPLMMLIREVIHFEHDAFKAILRPFFSLVSKMSHHTSLLFLLILWVGRVVNVSILSYAKCFSERGSGHRPDLSAPDL